MSSVPGDADGISSSASAFVLELFGDNFAPLRCQLWSKQSKKSHYADTPEQAGLAAASAPVDLYIATSLAPASFEGAHRRANAKQAAAIPGLWADIDVNGGPEGKVGAAPDSSVAEELAKSLLEPTILVNSGYGLQAWWLFDSGPWQIDNDDLRARAGAVAQGWQMRLKSRASEMGFTLDSTFDLARLMRLPGTFNGKGREPVPVSWIDEDERGPRYSLTKLEDEAAVGQLSTSASTPVSHVELRKDANPPHELFDAAMENSPDFAKSWRRKRPAGRPKKQWSASEWDMSLSSFAVGMGWADQQICDLLVAHRRKHGDDLKRADYYERTIGRARSSRAVERAEVNREEAIEELGAIAESDAPADHERTLHLFNTLLPARCSPVKEVVQEGRNPVTARLSLVLEDGETVPVGPMGNLLTQRSFREILATSTSSTMLSVKGDRWLKAVDALLSVVQVRETPDSTTEGIVSEWIRRYLEDRLTDDSDEAVRAREPFEEDGMVFIYVDSLLKFIRGQMREAILRPDLIQWIKSAGFQNARRTYRDGKKATSASYWCALNTYT